jgi:hypothetical protein
LTKLIMLGSDKFESELLDVAGDWTSGDGRLTLTPSVPMIPVNSH